MPDRSLLSLPVIDDLNRPFWDGCRAGALRLQACRPHGHLRYPVSDVCPTCLSTESEWRTMSGRGEILSWVVFHHAYSEAWKHRTPYNVVLVQLDEGTRLFGNVEPLDSADLSVGARVHVVFAEEGDPSAVDGAISQSVAIPRWELDA
jgi:uncharacterized OB-fold protein